LDLGLGRGGRGKDGGLRDLKEAGGQRRSTEAWIGCGAGEKVLIHDPSGVFYFSSLLFGTECY
jgi:hypothetical protein